MKSIKKYIRSKPHVAVSIPAAICSYDFISTVINLAKTLEGDIASLLSLSSMGGIEAVVLVIIVAILRKNACEKCGTKRSKKLAKES